MNRKIHIGKDIYEYRIGGDFIGIWDLKGKRHNIQITEFTGETWSNIERAKWKRYWKGVKPSQVKDWIENNLV